MNRCRPLALALLLVTPPLVGAQVAPRPPAPDAPAGGVDPRNVKDPRDATDPRDTSDPRDTGSSDPLLGPPGPELFDALYDSGQDARLKQALGENAWELLAYIQKQCDAWLDQRDAADQASATRKDKLAGLEEKGRKLARMADSTLLDSRFQTYVDAVFGWTDEQRQQHKESQELYRQGVALMAAAHERTETAAALTPLQQALDRARQIRDGRTQGEALVAIGSVQAALRDEAAARATMQEAARVGRELRDLDGVWSALSVQYESAIRTREWDLAEQALQEQYLIAQDVADPATVQRVLRQLVDLEGFRDDRR